MNTTYPDNETKNQSAVSVVVPCYFSGDSLPILVEGLVSQLGGQVAQFEIILVNDGSTDDTWDRIKKLSKTYPNVIGIDLTRNFGQHNALLTGIQSANGELIITVDDDLQHPPSEIPRLFEALTDDVDLVYGVPERERHGFFRDIASIAIKHAVEWTLGAHMAGSSSAFRLFRRKLLFPFMDFSSPSVDIDALLCWTTCRIRPIVVRHDERAFGESRYTMLKLIRHTINMIVSYSVVPLRLASTVGFVFTMIGFLILSRVLWIYFVHGSPVQGFTFVVCTISILSGAQLFAIGVLGEYLGRLHYQAMKYPVSTIRRSTQSDV